MAEILVVDSSVAAKWYLQDEDDNSLAITLLRHFGRGDLTLVGPDSLRSDVASAITVATLGRQPRMTVAQGDQARAG